MIAMEALADPEGGVRIDIAAPNGAEVVVRDEGSVIDSARVNAFGASVVTPVVIGDVSATVGAQLATMPPPD